MTNETQVMELVAVEAQPQRAVQAATQVSGSTPADLIRYAMESGADLDRLERLMDMQIKWEEREAEKAFAAAMAAFSENPPRIFKDKTVSYGEGRAKTQYDHASIGNACDLIKAALALHGLSHRWVTTQPDGKVRVECVITHKMGHSQSNFLESPPDSSGGKNSIQAIISARTYLERHTLFDATGCAPLDAPDDDGDGFTTDTSLADEWLAKVAVAPTEDDLVSLWQPGSQALAKDKLGFKEFEAAFIERRTVLAGAK